MSIHNCTTLHARTDEAVFRTRFISLLLLLVIIVIIITMALMQANAVCCVNIIVRSGQGRIMVVIQG